VLVPDGKIFFFCKILLMNFMAFSQLMISLVAKQEIKTLVKAKQAGNFPKSETFAQYTNISRHSLNKIKPHVLCMYILTGQSALSSHVEETSDCLFLQKKKSMSRAVQQ
jgi:hypothetical protein